MRIARVATRAGASTALVHHYFSTREELLEQALIHSFEQAGEDRFGEPREARRAPPRGSRARSRDCLPLPGPQEREWVLWVELWLRAVRDPDLRPVAARLYERYRDWIAELIRPGVASGEFRSDVDAEAVADLAMALLDGAGIPRAARRPGDGRRGRPRAGRRAPRRRARDRGGGAGPRSTG